MPQELEVSGFCAAAGGGSVPWRLPSWEYTLRGEMQTGNGQWHRDYSFCLSTPWENTNGSRLNRAISKSTSHGKRFEEFQGLRESHSMKNLGTSEGPNPGPIS